MTSKQHSFRSRWIDINGSRRNLLEWGSVEAPVVILQHGMRDHAHSWVWTAEHLLDRYRVIAPDLRGHGDSDWSSDGNYALSSYVIDLAEIVDALRLSDVRIVGHSFGGHVALQYAASFPERLASLFLIECIELPLIRQQRAAHRTYPELLKDWIAEESMRRTQSRRYYQSAEQARDRMVEVHSNIDPETIAYLSETGTILDGVLGYRWKYDPGCRLRPPHDQNGTDLDEVLEAIECPVMLAYGDASWIPHPPPERLARLRDHRLATFPSASHWLHHQRREAFLELLDAFLADPVGTIQIGNTQDA